MKTSPEEGGGFRERVGARLDSLSPRERAVTDFLLDRPSEAVTASAAELAARTGTSDATVVRTARSLGYGGLRELKRAIMDMLTTRRDPALVLDQRLERCRIFSETPEGRGFGVAALQAAGFYRFDPPRRGGRALPDEGLTLTVSFR